MTWAQDQTRFLEWIAGGLIAVAVALLCYLWNGTADAVDTNTTELHALKNQVEHDRGKNEVNEALLKEVRDDVKTLLNRLPGK